MHVCLFRHLGVIGAGSRTRTDRLLITNQALYLISYAGKDLATPTGFEPVISCVTGRRIGPAMLRCRLVVHPDGIEPPTRCL